MQNPSNRHSSRTLARPLRLLRSAITCCVLRGLGERERERQTPLSIRSSSSILLSPFVLDKSMEEVIDNVHGETSMQMQMQQDFVEKDEHTSSNAFLPLHWAASKSGSYLPACLLQEFLIMEVTLSLVVPSSIECH